MPVENHQHTVFVSYAREDKDWVTAAVNLLIAGGARVFMDVRNIAYGDKWQEVLRSKLREAERVMVIWSRHAAASEWVKEEWELALQDGKRLVPVPIDDTPLPERLSKFQALTDLKPLLQPGADVRESPRPTAQPSSLGRYGMLTVSIGVLLALPALLFLTPDSDELAPSIVALPPGQEKLPPLGSYPPTAEPVPNLLDNSTWLVAPGAFLVLALLTWIAVRWLRKRRKIGQRTPSGSPDLAERMRNAQADTDLGRRVVDMVFEDSPPQRTH